MVPPVRPSRYAAELGSVSGPGTSVGAVAPKLPLASPAAKLARQTYTGLPFWKPRTWRVL